MLSIVRTVFLKRYVVLVLQVLRTRIGRDAILMVLQDFWGLTGWDGRDQESRYPQAGRELRGQGFLQEPNDFLTVQTRLLTAIRENAVSILHGHF